MEWEEGRKKEKKREIKEGRKREERKIKERKKYPVQSLPVKSRGNLSLLTPQSKDDLESLGFLSAWHPYQQPKGNRPHCPLTPSNRLPCEQFFSSYKTQHDLAATRCQSAVVRVYYAALPTMGEEMRCTHSGVQYQKQWPLCLQKS